MNIKEELRAGGVYNLYWRLDFQRTTENPDKHNNLCIENY